MCVCVCACVRGGVSACRHACLVCVYVFIHLQLSSCIMQVWTSIGKFFKSMGHDRVSVSLIEREDEKTKIGGKRLEKTHGQKFGKKKEDMYNNSIIILGTSNILIFNSTKMYTLLPIVIYCIMYFLEVSCLVAKIT